MRQSLVAAKETSDSREIFHVLDRWRSTELTHLLHLAARSRAPDPFHPSAPRWPRPRPSIVFPRPALGRLSLSFFLGGFISWHCPGCSAC